MMIAKWIAKKFVIGLANEVLAKYKDDTAKCRELLKIWIARLQCIMLGLSAFLVKLDDGRIDDEEVDETAATIEDIVKDW